MTSPRRLLLLALLTFAWGINWPIVKVGVSGFPPFTFRGVSMLLGAGVLAGAMAGMRVPFHVPRRHWAEMARLTLANMVVWNALLMLAMPALPSGRAAILAYTMPLFAAMWGVARFSQPLPARQVLGLAAAALGVLLLLWHETDRLAGAPMAIAGILLGAAIWALGTHWLRATEMAVPTLTITFWMTAGSGFTLCAAGLTFEHSRWLAPSGAVVAAGLYNAVVIFGITQAVWFMLARNLPPVVSTLSTMLIPVVGTYAGALMLGETLSWQDCAALLLMAASIATTFKSRADRRRDASRVSPGQA